MFRSNKNIYNECSEKREQNTLCFYFVDSKITNTSQLRQGNQFHSIFGSIWLRLWLFEYIHIMGRPADFAFQDGSQSVVDCLIACLIVVETILSVNGVKYGSNNMKTGIDLDQMKPWAAAFKKMYELDVRGGHFGQDDMEAAVDAICQKPELQAAVRLVAANAGISVQELVSKTGYSFRVMLAHGHIRHLQHEKTKQKGKEIQQRTHPAWLIDVVSVISSSAATEPEVKAAAKPKPLGNPFIFSASW